MINARAGTLREKPAFRHEYRKCRALVVADGHIHDRMPVIIPVPAHAQWLDPRNEDLDGLERLLVPDGAGDLVARPVGRAVSNARNEEPGLVEPLATTQPGLALDAPPTGQAGAEAGNQYLQARYLGEKR